MQSSPTTHLSPANPLQPQPALLAYLPIVNRIALHINDRLPSTVDIDDLRSAGTLGLIQAQAKFNPAKNIPFLGFAQFRIRGAVLDSLRLLDWAPRQLRRKGRAAQEAIQKLSSQLRHTPSEEQVAVELGTTLKSYQKLQIDLVGTQILSLYQKRSQDSDEEELIDVAAPPADDPLRLCLAGEMQRCLTQAIEELTPKERLVTTLYYYEEMTVKEIGLALAMSAIMVSSIRRTALHRLRMALSQLSPGVQSDHSRHPSQAARKVTAASSRVHTSSINHQGAKLSFGA